MSALSLSADTLLAWNLYFPGEELEEGEKYALIGEMEEKLDKEKDFLNMMLDPYDKKAETLPLNYSDLSAYPQVQEVVRDMIVPRPEIGIPCFEFTLYQKLGDIRRRSRPSGNKRSSQQHEEVPPKLSVRFYNLDQTPLRSLKSNLIGRLVAVHGTVIRVSSIKPMVIRMDFKCGKCGALIPSFFRDGKYKTPTKCCTPQCRSKTFLPERSTASTVDWQKVKIQELDKKDPGRVPRTVECDLLGDLVDSCSPGDIVTVTGTIKALIADGDGKKGKDKNKALYLLYIDANSVDNKKVVSGAGQETQKIPARDLHAIHEVLQEQDLLYTFVNSICPGIFGHELVKAGLLLTLFGGCRKYTNARNRLPIRGDPHMLIVGDPGLGKSQMLTAVSTVAPRGVYVCGSYSSTSGLTVTLLKESGTGDYALEAGALVLGDLGVCCIDEFDKMSQEHQSLLEAMEQQSISIAKAGIVCNLPARTSVIAAANPVGGHYNRAKTVSENLKMNPALLSRFDLIFILLDNPDADRDQLLSEHVMAMHAGEDLKSRRGEEHFASFSAAASQEAKSLAKRLRRRPDLEVIHPVVVRKYIAYAREFCHPKLSGEACEQIQKFYLELRANHRGTESTPITTRQLESLIRLCEARARLELRENVTAQDAMEVIEIMKESLFQRFEDDRGQIDFRRSTGSSKSKEMTAFASYLQKKARDETNNRWSKKELTGFMTQLKVSDPTFLLEQMNHHGFLVMRPGGLYEIVH